MLLTKCSLVFAVFVSTLYWMVLFLRLITYKETIRYAKNPKPSIIISAKNASKCLDKNLPLVLKQEMIKELIVTNDYSEDETQKILENFEANSNILKIKKPSIDRPGKKLALTEAISSANSNHILLTDADCEPISDQWSSIMNEKVDKNHQLVLGFGPLHKKPKSFLNLFARYETCITAIQYFSFALFKIPYMGVGRNMLFTKGLFEKADGYKNHLHVASGDDDLFVKSIKDLTQTRICLDPNSFVYSEAPISWLGYYRQKTRHMATANEYSPIHKVLLSIHPFFHIISVLTSLLLLINHHWIFVFLIWGIKWLVLMIFGLPSFERLKNRDLIKFYPILDLALFLYYLIFSFGAFSKSSKNATWN